MSDKFSWHNLTRQQIGKYAEYLVKMEFTKHGKDVYTAEVDDKGIDCIVRLDHEKYFDIQIKSVRKSGYVFLPKAKFELRENLYAAVVLFNDDVSVNIYLIPSLTWEKPDEVFKSRDYDKEGQKSPPEWGIEIAKKHLKRLEEFKFDTIIKANF